MSCDVSTGQPPTHRKSKKAPKAIWVISGFFVLIAFLATLSAGFGVIALFGDQELAMQEITASNLPSKIKRKLIEIEEETTAIRQQYFPVLLFMEVFKLGMAAAFIVATLLMLTRNPNARKFTIAVCCFALAFHLLNLGIGLFLAAPTTSALGGLFDAMAADSGMSGQLNGSTGEQGRAMMLNATSSALTIAVCGTMMVKLVFYGIIMLTMCTEPIRMYFGEDLLKRERERLTQLQSNQFPMPG